MRQPSRRAFFGLTASLVGAAGCLGRRSGSNGATTSSTPTTTSASSTATAPTTTALGTEQSVGGVSVTVSNLSVRDSVLYLDTPDSMAVARREGERYVLVSVSGSESGPSSDSFALHLDDDRIGPADLRGGLDDYGPRYDPSYSGDEGYIPFRIPVGIDATDGRIVVEHKGETAAWRLRETALDALRRAKAEFELREVEIPETLLLYDPVSVRVSAENVSDVSGTFRGVLNVTNLVAAYAPYPFALDAAPGETVVWEKTFREGPSRDVESVGFFLETVAGETEVRATVRSRNETAQGTATDS